RQFRAVRLYLGEIDIPHRVVVPLRQLLRRFARQLPVELLPLPLRRLVLGHPEAAGQRDLDLILPRPPLDLGGRAAHRELPRRAPAKLDAGDFLLLAGLGAGGWHWWLAVGQRN